MTARAEYIAGLRELADLLERHDDLPLPYRGSMSDLVWIEVTRDADEQKALAAKFTRLIPSTISKEPRDTALDVKGSIRGLQVCMVVNRSAVCERIVKGTKTVTIPAKPAEPERTVEVDEVDWVCGSILDGTPKEVA